MEFVNKTQVHFEPGQSGSVDIGVTGEQYRTPAHWREKLGDLARLSYLRATAVIEVKASAASTAVVTVSIEGAAGALLSQELNFSGTDSVVLESELDLSTVKGHEPLAVVVNVGTADAGKTATVRGKLTLEHPLVISNC